MAVTKIWPIKDSLLRVVDYARNPEKTVLGDLQTVLHYAVNGEKTVAGEERAMYVTGVNCDRDTAFQEMRAIQERFGKTGGNVAYHAYQSFKPGEITPELCHKLGVELARRMWGDQYQVLVATHFNTGTYHNHLVCCSVGLWDGRKFNCNKRAYARFRSLSDELCREYGLSVIEQPMGKTPRALYFAEKNGEPTKFNLMREALNAALKVSVDAKDLERAMRDQGYILEHKPTHKYVTIRRLSDKKPVRTARLGDGYTKEAINQRLEENRSRYAHDFGFHRYRPEMENRPLLRHMKMRGSLGKTRKIGGLRGLYLHYCYRLGILPRNNTRRLLSPEMREECRRMDAISRQVRLICREKLDTTQDVEDLIARRKTESAELQSARQGCYNRLRRCEDLDEITEIKANRDKLTAALAACRKDIQTAQAILERSERMKENLKHEQEMQAQRMGRAKQKHRERNYER